MMNVADVMESITTKKIIVTALRTHSKASEEYADVIFKYPGEADFMTSIPFQYRRAGVFIDNPKELAEFIESIYPHCSTSRREAWALKEKEYWTTHCSGRETTKGFFDKLTSLKWNCVKSDFPQNPNWARRVQDIKEMGYLLSTNTRMFCPDCEENQTQIILLPIDRGQATGYEAMSAVFKARVISLLGPENVYEARATNKASLIPDHKFPEIRWDKNTKQEDLDSMTDEEIEEKFQLIDNQRNQQKREVCRECFQTGKRGIIFGVKYFYAGKKEWPKDIPKVGKAAEAGCIGCGWYDIAAWRESIET